MKTKPFPHQTEFLIWVKDKTTVPLILDRGLGKTWCALALIEQRNYAHTLWVCPRMFAEETLHLISEHSELNAVGVFGNPAQKAAILQRESQIYVVGYESLVGKGRSPLQSYVSKHKWDCIVADESTRIKNPQAKRTKLLHKLSYNADCRLIATGDPITNSLLDVWGQWFFLDHGNTFGSSFYRFRIRYFVEVAEHLWVPRPDTKKMFRQKIRDTSFVRQKHECIKLPPQKLHNVVTGLPYATQRIYDEFCEKFAVELSNKQTLTTNYVLVKLTKLCQIASGFAVSDERITTLLPTGKRGMLKCLLTDLFEQYNAIVIWCRFKQEVRDVERVLKSMDVQHVLFYGNASTKDTVRTFQQNADTRAIVLTYAKGHAGITLTKAQAAVLYGHDHSVEHQRGALDRVHRIGSEKFSHIDYYYLFCRNTVEEKVIADTKFKSALARQTISRADVLEAILPRKTCN